MEEQTFLYTIYYRLYIIFLNYVTLNKHIYYYYYSLRKYIVAWIHLLQLFMQLIFSDGGQWLKSWL